MDANTIYDAAVSGDVSRVDALLKQAPELVNAADPYGFTPPEGEPVIQFSERVLGAVARLHQAYAGQRVLLAK